MLTKDEIRQLAGELIVKLDHAGLLKLENVLSTRDMLARTIVEWLGAYTEVHIE